MSVVETGLVLNAAERERPAVTRAGAARRVSVGLLGYGRVGQAVASVAASEHARLRAAGVELRFAGALVRDPEKRRTGPPVALHTASNTLFSTRFDVVIDVMGGEHPAFELLSHAIESGAHVVTANKTLVAARGRELRALAAKRGVAFVYDAAVLAGVPFLGAFSRRPLIASPTRITGIINGTSHFITTELEKGGSLQAALDEATARGYAEPDSSADLSGRDAAEKLTILLHLVGCRDLEVADLTTCHLSTITPADVLAARAFGCVIKPVALASLDTANPGAWVGPAAVDRAHPFASLTGVGNAVEFAGTIGDPVTFAGPGAGPRVTAATILDDVVEAATGVGRGSTAPLTEAPLPASFRRPPAGRWYLRVANAEITVAQLADKCAANRLPVQGLIECGRALVGRTTETPWSVIGPGVDALRAEGLDVLALPIVVRN